MQIITLTTDNGYHDYYVAAIKGRLLQAFPAAHVIDISHGITPFNISEAAFQLRCCFHEFVEGTKDWGHAKDYVEAMWRILQQDVAEDYVIATGVTTYIRDFVRLSFAEVGIELSFEGEQENEIAKVAACKNPLYQLPIGNIVVRVDPQYYRPTEVDLLIGDPTKSKTKLGWEPKYDLAGLVKEMVESDLQIFNFK